MCSLLCAPCAWPSSDSCQAAAEFEWQLHDIFRYRPLWLCFDILLSDTQTRQLAEEMAFFFPSRLPQHVRAGGEKIAVLVFRCHVFSLFVGQGTLGGWTALGTWTPWTMVMETGNEEEASCADVLAGTPASAGFWKPACVQSRQVVKGLSRRRLTPEVVVTPTHGSRVSWRHCRLTCQWLL